jgi:hypothetical protein
LPRFRAALILPACNTEAMNLRFAEIATAVEPAAHAVVCTENSIRVDYVTESPNLSGDDRFVLSLLGPVRLAVQVERPT